jgi:hypothetical protein
LWARENFKFVKAKTIEGETVDEQALPGKTPDQEEVTLSANQ